MAISLKHIFQSAKADGVDNALIQPSNWNDEHTLTVSTNKIIGRSTAGTGDAEEIAIGTALQLSGGTLSVSTVPVANGGTGANTLASNNVILGNGTSPVQAVAPGAVGNILTSNGTTWVSQSAPSGGTVTLTASGSISAGAPVIQNADGTVSSVAGTLGSAQLGDIVTNGNTANSGTYAAAYDPNFDRVVWATRNSSNQVTLNISRAVGDGITFEAVNLATIGASAGTPVSIVYNPDVQRFVVFYTNASGFACARVFTIAGDNVQLLGAEVIFNSVTTWDTEGVYDPVSKKVVVLLGHNTGTNSRARCYVATMTSTSISFGTAVDAAVAYQGVASDLGIVYEPVANKVVIAYGNATGFGSMMVGTVSGTSISFGSASANFGTNSWDFPSKFSLVFDDNAGKVVAVYQDGDISGTGGSIVGTVSGTSITLGTAVGLGTGLYFTAGVYDPMQKKVVAIINSGSNNYLIGTVSGTSISWSGLNNISTATTTSYVAATYANNNQTPVLFFYSNSLTKYTGTVLQTYTVTTTNLSNINFVGFSTASYTNGQTAVINIVGSVNTSQTGLKAGQTYYVQPDGTLNVYPYWVNVYAGRAISATSLVVKG